MTGDGEVQREGREEHEGDDSTMIALDDGTVLYGIHSEDNCSGSVCWLHKPTDHPYRKWPTAWRDSVGMLMRVCEHDEQHFDPDSMARLAEIVSGSQDDDAAMIFVHDCDGCGSCYSLDLPEIIVTDSNGVGLDSDTWSEYQEHMREHHDDECSHDEAGNDDEHPWGEHEHDENCTETLSVAYNPSSETVAFTLTKHNGESTTGFVPVTGIPMIIDALQGVYVEWSERDQ